MSMPLSSSEKRTIIVTGFGPFRAHKINASWEAVKLLPEMLDVVDLNIILIVQEIPVDYEESVKRLTVLCEEHKPILVINVGVSDLAKEITLETCASKHGYEKPDVQGKIPTEKKCCLGNFPMVSTKLAVEKLADDLNNLKMGVSFCTSSNAGLYLCEFTYYTSLCLNEQNSLFVHVPDIDKPYKPQETAQGLCAIIRLALAQIKDDKQVKQY
ncbi:Pyroglutamyl-peptidase 1 [Frankliniella fusca]|uniref:Pyroglutamyl-peptidase 1 n=1 Tax=Frankliniella fusca TaxID=407009 RepID=A0AAE1LA26_9NEOP|nr:Pyroglutamyl-peptidase 1 [Frankliniella fusca]